MIYVVGAVCFDVIAERDSYIQGTSNPAKITARLGGVAYNIFSHLKLPRRLVTALGDDDFSLVIKHMLESELPDGDEAIILPATSTPSPFYLAIMESGELNVAASQMDVVDRSLTADAVLTALGDVSAKDIVVLDANLSVDALETSLSELRCRCKVVFEPISVGKAERHVGRLHDVFLATPEEREFGCLLGDSAVSDAAVFSYLEDRDIDYILRTRGSEGATLYGSRQRRDFPPFQRIRTGDSTGAGDMITALLTERIHGRPGPVPFDELAGEVPMAMRAVERYLAKRSTN